MPSATDWVLCLSVSLLLPYTDLRFERRLLSNVVKFEAYGKLPETWRMWHTHRSTALQQTRPSRNPPKRKWRKWQTHQLEGLARAISGCSIQFIESKRLSRVFSGWSYGLLSSVLSSQAGFSGAQPLVLFTDHFGDAHHAVAVDEAHSTHLSSILTLVADGTGPSTGRPARSWTEAPCCVAFPGIMPRKRAEYVPIDRL